MSSNDENLPGQTTSAAVEGWSHLLVLLKELSDFLGGGKGGQGGGEGGGEQKCSEIH